jgi:hypothetical protein
MNRKRLAITAAIIGAIAFPPCTGVLQNAFNRYGYTCLQLTDYVYGTPIKEVPCYDPIWWLLISMLFGAAFAVGGIYLIPAIFSLGRRLFAMWLRWVGLTA